MFDVIIFFGFASLIVRFSRILNQTEDNVERLGDYIEAAHNKLNQER